MVRLSPLPELTLVLIIPQKARQQQQQLGPVRPGMEWLLITHKVSLKKGQTRIWIAACPNGSNDVSPMQVLIQGRTRICTILGKVNVAVANWHYKKKSD